METKSARTGHLWTCGKNYALLKKQTNSSETEHRTLCVNHTLTFLRSNVQHQFECCLNPTMMILYSGWYLFVIQNNSDFFQFFRRSIWCRTLKQSRPFVKYSNYCRAWKDRNNCQKKNESLIHWEGKQKTTTTNIVYRNTC